MIAFDVFVRFHLVSWMISARLRTLDYLRGSRSKHLDPSFVHVST
jgi:hypothetical protein